MNRNPQKTNQSSQHLPTTAEVHETFFDHLTPSPALEELVSLNRAYRPANHRDVVRCASRSDVRTAIEKTIAAFTPEAAEEASLLERDAGGQLIVPGQLLRARVLYCNRDAAGAVLSVQPERRNLKGQAGLPFGLQSFTDATRPLILVEGQADALALIARGRQAVALGGIRNFVGGKFKTLVGLLREARVSEIVVLFDNPLQDRPYLHEPLRANPKYKESLAARHHPQEVAIQQGHLLEAEGFKVGYVHLPDAARVDGEADVDGALVARTLTDGGLSALLGAPCGFRAT